MTDKIDFSSLAIGQAEKTYVDEVLSGRMMSGDGAFTMRCQSLLEDALSVPKVFLTHSCTAALEMAARLVELGPGDEVIVPSYTFSSTANAIVLTGATPVFCDVREDDLNIDISKVVELITPKTKALFVTHYAGRSPDMVSLKELTQAKGIPIVEDAAQSLGATYLGRPAGRSGAMSTFSFHETKNVVSGEGGALAIVDDTYIERAAIIREKGTNRSAFLEGHVDKYTWVDLGSSYLPSELIAAVLHGQLEREGLITQRRRQIYQRYADGLQALKAHGLQYPALDTDTVQANGHIFFMLLPEARQRAEFMNRMKSRGVITTFHYLPLHSAPAGLKFGRAPTGCPVTEDVASRLVRLPMHMNLSDTDCDTVVESVLGVFEEVFL
ncbi:MAG: dTDP-4-amino-4,6-dideoxygalactose transaminase [Pseudomonadota bacterium]